jgi:hypothetical protein
MRSLESELVEVPLPVGRDLARRARYRLIEWMVFGRGQRGTLVGLLGDIVPEPVLARLEAPDQGMPGLGCVFAGVLSG